MSDGDGQARLTIDDLRRRRESRPLRELPSLLAEAVRFVRSSSRRGASLLAVTSLVQSLLTIGLLWAGARLISAVQRLVVMVQREVGERLAATPGDQHYGAVSVKVAYRARATITRRVPSTVFWPKPSVDSVVVRLDRLPSPAVDVDAASLWRVVDGAFAERRKTMRNALRRLDLPATEADAILIATGVSASARPEELDLATFAAIASAVPA